jgi:hypothetical protein
MFAKAAIILCLFAAPVAALPGSAQAASAVQVTTTATKAGARHLVYRAAARAVERRLLLVAPRSRLLARFVDRSTGLVKLNVTAHCQLKRRPHRPSIYLCRVWRQPRRPSSGIRVLCRTKHKRFVVKPYLHRRKNGTARR